jgi:hypothetical protein
VLVLVILLVKVQGLAGWVVVGVALEVVDGEVAEVVFVVQRVAMVVSEVVDREGD